MQAMWLYEFKTRFSLKNTGKIWKDLVRLEYSNIIFDK